MSLNSLSSTPKNNNVSVLKAFSISKYKTKPATPGSLRKKNSWVTLEDGSLIALPDDTTPSKIITTIETNEVTEL